MAVGDRTSLNELHAMIHRGLETRIPGLTIAPPVHRDFRPGDVRHSLADISKARESLGYEPSHTVSEGIEESLNWYIGDLGPDRQQASLG